MDKTMHTEVLVCGGGIAGAMAAIAAGRRGVHVTLVERGTCLGGVITASLVGIFLDAANKGGLTAEFLRRLDEERAAGGLITEAEKYLLARMVTEAGVQILYNTQVISVERDLGRLRSVTLATPSGQRKISADVFIDATGNGDVAAMSGCGFSVGNEQGQLQPASMIGIVTGVDRQAAEAYIGFGRREAFKAYLETLGISTSYGAPCLMEYDGDLYALCVNHEYGVRFDDAEKIGTAISHGRAELYETARALRAGGGAFANLMLVATPEMLGIREGRRIHGDYTVTLDDVLAGRSQPDAVCRVTYWVDIHALTGDGDRSFSGEEIQCQPYDIPFRAQIARHADNLILAGRCISGDFYAHASYRVAGNMAATGEAAGIMAARCVQENAVLRSLTYVRPW